MRIRVPARFCLFILFVLLVASRPLAAQTDRSVLEGTITDRSGGTVAGADVKATEVDTGITLDRRSNRHGYFFFPGLAVGRYSVSVSKDGFATRVVDGVVLRVGEDHTLDVRLQVGGMSQRVVVTAQTEPVERTSPADASVISNEQIQNLPTNGRDWAELTILAPFAQDDGGGDQRTIRFAGRARDDNNFSIDGVDAGGIQEQAQKSSVRLQISEDAVAEYRVNSALYDTEYGTQSGGQINVVTKSGTNDFHGTVFGYLRNSVFDGRNFNDYINDAAGNQIPVRLPFRMGNFGMTLGGPIQKDKTFFFISYEGLRQQQDASTAGQTFVPSASLIQDILVNGRNGVGPSPAMCGVLQGFPWRASLGSVGGCTPKYVYPDSAFVNCANANANCGLSLTAGEDLTSDVDSFTHPIITKINEDSWLARVDHKFSDKTTMYVRAQRDVSASYSQINVSATGLDSDDVFNHPANYLAAVQHTFTPNVFNETKFYINRSPFHNPHGSTLPFAVSTELFSGIPNESADIEVGTTFGVVDNLTFNRGRNTFKMGMEYRRVRLNQGQTADNNLTFSTDQNMIEGSLANLTFNAPWCCHGLRRNFFMPYFQDEWKMTPTFTVTAGVRYEYYGVPTEATNRTTVFDINQFHGVCLGSGSTNGPFPMPINTPGCPTDPSLTNPDYRDVDPRLGIAWAPGALNGKTVIRAGFGIYHGAAQNDDENAGLESDTYRVVTNQSVPMSAAYAQEIPDLSGAPISRAAAHPRALQREGRRNLYVEDWGLTVEQAMPDSFIFSASYLGSHGVRLFSRGGVNLCTTPVTMNPVTGDCFRPLDQYYTDPNNPDPFGSVDYKSDIGQSTYHALGLSLERHFSNGFTLLSRYTWSHSINDGSVGGGESNGPENVNCLECDKGPSIYDIRNNFITDAVYQLPFGPGARYLHDSGALGKIVGGWQLSGMGMWHTGHPLTVGMDLSAQICDPSQITNQFYADCTNPNFMGTSYPSTYLLPDGNDQTSQRPDIVPGVSLTLPGGGRNGVPLVNAAAFQAPPVDANGNFTRYGDASNGLIRALPSWQIDVGLQKDTQLTERFTLEFAVQAFNILNHIQLGDPGSLTLAYNPASASTGYLDTPPGFGVITSTVNYNSNNDNDSSPNVGTGLPRQVQFMLRLKF
jgi:hypothetical protein